MPDPTPVVVPGDVLTWLHHELETTAVTHGWTGDARTHDSLRRYSFVRPGETVTVTLAGAHPQARHARRDHRTLRTNSTSGTATPAALVFAWALAMLTAPPLPGVTVEPGYVRHWPPEHSHRPAQTPGLRLVDTHPDVP